MAILNRDEIPFDLNADPPVLQDFSVPDLVFLEFSVNDSHGPYETILADMEDIVHQIWTLDPEIDIVLVHTGQAVEGYNTQTGNQYESIGSDYKTPTNFNDIYSLNQGRYQVPAAAFEEVADFYDIPSIHVFKEYARMADNGEYLHQSSQLTKIGENAAGNAIAEWQDVPNPLDLPVFSADGIHPDSHQPDGGHFLYKDALLRAFNR